MKSITKYRLIQVTVTIVILLILPTIVLADDPGAGADAPIDGGLSILIAAGVGYGIKRVKEHRNHSKSTV